MNARAGRYGWIAGGFVCLILFFAFCGAAFLTLISSGGGDWPPAAYIARLTSFTLEQAVLSTVLSLGLGLPVALIISRRTIFVGRSALIALMMVPLGLPVLPAVFGILTIWGRHGLVNQVLGAADLSFNAYGLAGILIAHVFFNLPLAARLMFDALERIQGDQHRLAESLGLSPTQIFRFVEWPALSRVLPGISGLIFMLCITSFTIVLTLGGGPQSSTLEVAIYQALKFDFDPVRAAVLSLIQLGLTTLVFVALSRLPDPEEERAAGRSRSSRRTGNAFLRHFDIPILLAFVAFTAAPLAAIFVAGINANLGALIVSAPFLTALETSLLIAAAAAILSVTTTYLIARGRLALAERWMGLSTLFRFPEFALLIPPVALGSGWFLIAFRMGVDRQAAMPLVIVINVIMSLPFTIRVVGPALRTHVIRTSRLADSLGISGFARTMFVDWPVMRRPLLIALSFAAALSLGDLGAIALFGSDNFITLPSLLYARLGSYRSNDAAGLALILSVLCFVLILPSVAFRQQDTDTE
jgi:thiamine transport system permease protein